MDIAEIDSVLCPDMICWQEKESAILAQNCTYPYSAPKTDCVAFSEFWGRPLQLQRAVFEVDHSSITDGKVARFFQSEMEPC
jgi:hypothetical protein